MEHLSIVLTNYIFKKGIIDEKNYEIYQYGFQCFLEVSASTICSIVIALLLHMFPNACFSSYCSFQCVHSAAACI